MARKKQSPSPSPELIRVLGLTCILIVGMALAGMSVISFLRTSPLFTIKEISVADNIQPLDVPELAKLKGQNILAADLTRVEQRLRAKYPQLAELSVTRRFPDQIFIAAVKRDVFARASFDGKLYVIDPDGFIISAPQGEQGSLPLIKGLKRQKAPTGDPVENERMRIASSVILLFRQEARLAAIGLREVNVTDLMRVICVVGGDNARFEVIIDKDNIPARLKDLSDVLARGGVDLTVIKYIDFRFGAPVIGQKKVKK
jgi:hypothetical protein